MENERHPMRLIRDSVTHQERLITLTSTTGTPISRSNCLASALCSLVTRTVRRLYLLMSSCSSSVGARSEQIRARDWDAQLHYGLTAGEGDVHAAYTTQCIHRIPRCTIFLSVLSLLARLFLGFSTQIQLQQIHASIISGGNHSRTQQA